MSHASKHLKIQKPRLYNLVHNLTVSAQWHLCDKARVAPQKVKTIKTPKSFHTSLLLFI